MALFDWFTADRADLRDAYDELQFMMQRGDEMFSAATGRLLDNEILDVDLVAMDDEVNGAERHLRQIVLDNLKAAGPDRLEDLLKVLGVVQEAERIGDLSKTIAQVAELAEQPRMAPLVTPFRDIRDRVSDMFELTRQGFSGHSEDQASEVLSRHDQLKADVNTRIAALASESALSPNLALVLGLGARMMGRVSSHLANIASAVVFPYPDLRRTHPSE